jgi:alkylation response protein AidB-like acyl-CoA dehydrogenase
MDVFIQLFSVLKSVVAGLTCSAKREGNEWVITGNKKWITNGM